MFDRRNVIAVLLAGALAAGCSEGTTDPPDATERLSEAESLALFEAMRAIQTDTAATIIGGTENSLVIACPLGGQVTITIDVVEESVADTARLRSDFHGRSQRLPGVERRDAVHRGRPSERPRTDRRHHRRSVRSVHPRGFSDRSAGLAVRWPEGPATSDLTLSGGLDSSGTEPSLAAVLAGTLCGHETRLDIEDVPGGPSG